MARNSELFKSLAEAAERYDRRLASSREALAGDASPLLRPRSATKRRWAQRRGERIEMTAAPEADTSRPQLPAPTPPAARPPLSLETIISSIPQHQLDALRYGHWDGYADDYEGTPARSSPVRTSTARDLYQRLMSGQSVFASFEIEGMPRFPEGEVRLSDVPREYRVREQSFPVVAFQHEPPPVEPVILQRITRLFVQGAISFPEEAFSRMFRFEAARMMRRYFERGARIILRFRTPDGPLAFRTTIEQAHARTDYLRDGETIQWLAAIDFDDEVTRDAPPHPHPVALGPRGYMEGYFRSGGRTLPTRMRVEDQGVVLMQGRGRPDESFMRMELDGTCRFATEAEAEAAAAYFFDRGECDLTAPHGERATCTIRTRVRLREMRHVAENDERFVVLKWRARFDAPLPSPRAERGYRSHPSMTIGGLSERDLGRRSEHNWVALDEEPMRVLTAEELAERAERERERLEAARAREREQAAAKERARALLLSQLTEAQREEFKLGHITVRGGMTGVVYRIKTGGTTYNIKVMDEGGEREVLQLCAAPSGNMPLDDKLLGQVLALKCDERRFIATCNKSAMGTDGYALENALRAFAAGEPFNDPRVNPAPPVSEPNRNRVVYRDEQIIARAYGRHVVGDPNTACEAMPPANVVVSFDPGGRARLTWEVRGRTARVNVAVAANEGDLWTTIYTAEGRSNTFISPVLPPGRYAWALEAVDYADRLSGHSSAVHLDVPDVGQLHRTRPDDVLNLLGAPLRLCVATWHFDSAELEARTLPTAHVTLAWENPLGDFMQARVELKMNDSWHLMGTVPVVPAAPTVYYLRAPYQRRYEFRVRLEGAYGASRTAATYALSPQISAGHHTLEAIRLLEASLDDYGQPRRSVTGEMILANGSAITFSYDEAVRAALRGANAG